MFSGIMGSLKKCLYLFTYREIKIWFVLDLPLTFEGGGWGRGNSGSFRRVVREWEWVVERNKRRMELIMGKVCPKGKLVHNIAIV